MASKSKDSTSSVSCRISEERIGKAVDAILKWVKSKAKHQKAQLLDHDELLYLVLSLKKIPATGKTNPFKIPLPHPLFSFDGTEEICLIIDDRAKGLNSKVAKQKIEEEKIPVSKVLKLSKLKSDYKPFESRRKLCGSFDLFFADRRVIPLLPRLLGKTFFKKKRLPIPVDLTNKNWKKQMQNACGSAFLYLRTGTCSTVKVGKISQSRDEILRNVLATIEGIASVVPKKWANIRSLHLKSLESLALPLYQSIPDMGLKIEGLKAKEPEEKIESADEARSEQNEENSGGRGSKKGKIHEFRYMDYNVDDVNANFSVNDNENVGGGSDGENQIEELGLAKKKGKKRKKADSKLDQVPNLQMTELNDEQLKKSKKKESIAKQKNMKESTLDELPVSSFPVSLDGVMKKKKKKNNSSELVDAETKSKKKERKK